MPNWKMHVILTLVLYIIFINVFGFTLKLSIVALVLLIFSSVLPDIDHHKSKIRDITTGVFFFIGFVFLFDYLQYSLLEKSIFSLFGGTIAYLVGKHLPLTHRGKKSLHQWHLSLFVPFCFAVVFYILKINYLLSFFVFFGYIVHLLLDRVSIKVK